MIAVDTAALGSLTLPDHTGAGRRVADEWAVSPAVFVFLRHFG
jgi:hypothetical protein